jgi:IS30 family transposase
VLAMKQRPRIYYTEAQKAMMWDRWSKGDTLRQLGKLFDRPHTSIQHAYATAFGTFHAPHLLPPPPVLNTPS